MIVVNLVSSEEEEEEVKQEVKKHRPRRANKRQRVEEILDPLDKENWTNRRLDVIVGVDPAPKNFSICKYSVGRDEITAWDWVDFQGVNMTKLSAGKIVDRLDQYVDNNPEFFRDADLIVVERQIVINACNIRVQMHIMKRFPQKCIEADPKQVKSFMNRWRAMPTAQYSKKKKTTVDLGMSVITAKEQRLLDALKRGRLDLQKKITEHDTKMISQGRTKRKKPRRIKTQPADLFDALMIALCVACELLDRDIVSERLERKRKTETLFRWIG